MGNPVWNVGFHEGLKIAKKIGLIGILTSISSFFAGTIMGKIDVTNQLLSEIENNQKENENKQEKNEIDDNKEKKGTIKYEKE